MGELDRKGWSKSSVRKAGSTIRAFHRQEVDGAELMSALDVLTAYRREFQPGLAKYNMGLRSFARTLGLSAKVTERHKKERTIIEKLSRLPDTDLSRMRDIGGCRAVLDPQHTIEDLYRLRDHIERRWHPTWERDYIAKPRVSGYRAIHLEVRTTGLPFELQLRTAPMHNWAELTEAFSDLKGFNYKTDGDSEIHEFFKNLSVVLAASEEGSQPHPQALQMVSDNLHLLNLPISKQEEIG